MNFLYLLLVIAISAAMLGNHGSIGLLLIIVFSVIVATTKR